MEMRINRRSLVLAALLALCGAAGLSRAQDQNPAATKHVDVPTVAPRPEDVSSLDGIIKAFYEVVSGPAGQPRHVARSQLGLFS